MAEGVPHEIHDEHEVLELVDEVQRELEVVREAEDVPEKVEAAGMGVVEVGKLKWMLKRRMGLRKGEMGERGGTGLCKGEMGERGGMGLCKEEMGESQVRGKVEQG